MPKPKPDTLSRVRATPKQRMTAAKRRELEAMIASRAGKSRGPKTVEAPPVEAPTGVEPGTPPAMTIVVPKVDAPSTQRARVSVLTLTLEEAWKDIQIMHPEVPNVVVIVGPVSMDRGRMDRYGHFTLAKSWRVRDDAQHEVLIAAEGLGRGARQVFRTLLHESVHAAQETAGIKGVTQRGVHNATFRKGAEAFGLVCDDNEHIGCVTPDITEETAAAYASTIKRIETALVITRTAGSVDPDALAKATFFLWAAWGHGWKVDTGGEGAWGILPKSRPRSVRAGENAVKVSCGCRSIRAFPSCLAQGPITCSVCGGDFQ